MQRMGALYKTITDAWSQCSRKRTSQKYITNLGSTTLLLAVDSIWPFCQHQIRRDNRWEDIRGYIFSAMTFQMWHKQEMSSWHRESGMKKCRRGRQQRDWQQMVLCFKTFCWVPSWFWTQCKARAWVKFHWVQKNFSNRKLRVRQLCVCVCERETEYFFFSEKLRNRTPVYAYLEFRGCFHSSSTMHEKQQGGGHPLCPQSHDSTEGMGEGGGSTRKSVDEEEKK